MTIKANPPTLVADVGGTNARFALAHINGQSIPGEHIPLKQLQIFSTRKISSLQDALYNYLSNVSGEKPIHAVLAVAAPVIHGYVQFSNFDWEYTEQSLAEALHLKQVHLLNDFAAIASAIPQLRDKELDKIGQGHKDPDGPVVVLGPGTGMGMAALMPLEQRWKVIPGEGGHIGFAPANDLECEILKLLFKQYPRVIVEQLLSGRGLVALYTALAEIKGRSKKFTDPESITESGIKGSDELCLETLEIFCAMLGSYAGDIAITFNATGGVYLAGGIIAKIQNIFNKSHFRLRFEDKGSVVYVKDIPTFQIIASQPALIGASLWAAQKFHNKKIFA